MSLNYCSRTVANTRVLGISGMPGIGVYQLRISVEFAIPNWEDIDDTAVITNLRGEVFAGATVGACRTVGFAEPEQPLILKPGKFVQQTNVMFFLNLSGQQLFALESVRNGGGLHLKLVLTGEANGTVDGMVTRDEVAVEITLSDWARVLKEIGYRDILVVGMELPTTTLGEKLKPARDQLLQAHDDLIGGRYDDVVARCRKALDSVQAILDEKELATAAVDKFLKGPRRQMSKLEREFVVGEAARNYAHLAHHVDQDGEQEWYSRADATFLLALAIAVISSAGARQLTTE